MASLQKHFPKSVFIFIHNHEHKTTAAPGEEAMGVPTVCPVGEVKVFVTDLTFTYKLMVTLSKSKSAFN